MLSLSRRLSMLHSGSSPQHQNSPSKEPLSLHNSKPINSGFRRSNLSMIGIISCSPQLRLFRNRSKRPIQLGLSTTSMAQALGMGCSQEYSPQPLHLSPHKHRLQSKSSKSQSLPSPQPRKPQSNRTGLETGLSKTTKERPLNSHPKRLK